MAANRDRASSAKRSTKPKSAKPSAPKKSPKRRAAPSPATRAAKAPPRAVAKRSAAPAVERVFIEIPARGRKVSPDALKTCGEMISRLSGGRPVVFTFDDRVVALATSYIRKGDAVGAAAGSGFGPERSRPKVPLGMQLEWKRRGVDLQTAVDRARAVTNLERTRLAFVRQGRTRDADAMRDAIYAERAGIDTRDWDLPALIPSGRYDG